MRVDLTPLWLACVAACFTPEKEVRDPSPPDSSADADADADSDGDADSDADSDSDADGDADTDGDVDLTTDTAGYGSTDTHGAIDSGVPADTSLHTDTGPSTSTTDTSPRDTASCTGGYPDRCDDACGPAQWCVDCPIYDTSDTDIVIIGVEWLCLPCGVVCGRPLRDGRGRPVRGAATRTRRATGSRPMRRRAAPRTWGLTPAERAALAGWWTEEAIDEHGSVASFAGFILDLIEVGAPDHLIRGARRARRDEARHARNAFALASAFAGHSLAPGRVPESPGRGAARVDGGSLVALAVATFLDGCLNETLATALAMARLDAAVDPAVRRALAVVVRDETRHAALAWRTVAWALAVGGPPVRAALCRAAAAAVPPLPPVAEGAPAVPSHGLIAPGEAARVSAHAWVEVIQPAMAALGLPSGGLPSPRPQGRTSSRGSSGSRPTASSTPSTMPPPSVSDTFGSEPT